MSESFMKKIGSDVSKLSGMEEFNNSLMEVDLHDLK